jgi:hypothetical protein
MDNFEQLEASAQILSSIIGCPEKNQFWVVEEPVPESVTYGLASQGMRFCGYMGLVDGAPRTALAEELSPNAMAGLTAIFVQQVNRIIAARLAQPEPEPEPKDDFVAWAEALHNLEDSRPN